MSMRSRGVGTGAFGSFLVGAVPTAGLGAFWGTKQSVVEWQTDAGR